MTERVSLLPVSDAEQSDFLQMAEAYFQELNPVFSAHVDWRENYFRRLQSGGDIYLRWIQSVGVRAGFVIYGLEQHRFLPRINGCVYELYILPRFRRTGIGKAVAQEVIRLLHDFSPSKIQLEIAAGNRSAAAFWQSLGFRKVSERYVLEKQL